MKKLNNLLYISAFTLLAYSCTVPDGIDQDTEVMAEMTQNLNAAFDVSNDNSGNVKIIPTGQSATMFNVEFGDGTGSDASATVKPGESVMHSYPEGDFNVKITATNAAGEKSSSEFPLSVVYRAPENLMVSPNVTGYELTVSAEADYANGFMVYYGDMENEEGTEFGVGETAPAHTYAEAGQYDVRVVALSGGAATSETTTQVTIYDPFKLPISFDEPWVNYFFGTFDDWGMQQFQTVDNPDKSGMNTSDKVGKFINGHAPWSGTYSPLNEPINFIEGQVVKMMVYNPDPANIGKKINMELEWPVGASEAQPYGAVLKMPITKSGEWEEITFDFSGIESIPDDAMFTQLVFRFNDIAEGAGEEIYFDNIILTN
ncbi:MAG: hypothetical protein CME35_09340 [Gramella sp.]|nr:hypothetical protein [Christiangramia sp.]